MRFKTDPIHFLTFRIIKPNRCQRCEPHFTESHLMMWVISQQFAKFTDHEYCSLSVIWTEIHVLSGVYYKSSCFEIFSVISTGHSNLAVLFDSAKSVMSGKLLAICHTIIQVQWNSFFFFCVTWDSVNTVKQNRIICEQGKEKKTDETKHLCFVHNI